MTTTRPKSFNLVSKSTFNVNKKSLKSFNNIYSETYISGTPGTQFPKTTGILNIENLDQRKSIINNFRIVIIDYYSNRSKASKVLKEQSSFIYKDYETKYPFIKFGQ